MSAHKPPRIFSPPSSMAQLQAKTADCSQGFCSVYCPQWCFIVQPSPPIFAPQESLPNTAFSPFFISIISILALSLLLILYYAVFSRSCNRSENRSTPRRDSLPVDWWYSPSDGGIEESQIKSIRAIKFFRGEERETSDCSICLGEFQEEETLRLLPRCDHAFHISCIDVWLRSNSRCPLCRRGVFSAGDAVQEEEEAEEEGGGEGRSYGDEEGGGVRVIRRSLSVMEASRMDIEAGSLAPPEDSAAGRMTRVFAAAGESSYGGDVAAPPMKRSFSCGRFGFTRHGRWSSSVLPF